MEVTDLRKQGILGLRLFQIVCIGFVVTGFIWGTSDYLLIHVLKDSPVTPFSVVLMLYGSLGVGLVEVVVRWLSRGIQADPEVKKPE